MFHFTTNCEIINIETFCTKSLPFINFAEYCTAKGATAHFKTLILPLMTAVYSLTLINKYEYSISYVFDEIKFETTCWECPFKIYTCILFLLILS